MTVTPEEVDEQIKSDMDALEHPPEAPEEIVVYLGVGDQERAFVARPLGWFGKIDLVKLLGSALKKATGGGEDSVSLEDLSVFFADDGVTLDALAKGEADAKDAQSVFKILLTLTQHIPDLFERLYCIVLGVPRTDWDWAIERMPIDVTDAQGKAVLQSFMRTDWMVVKDFFDEDVRPLMDRIQARRSQATAPSTRSRPSRPNSRSRSKKS